MREITSTVPPGLGQHAPQVDDHLSVDVLAARRVEDFGFGAQRHLDLAVVLLGGGPDVVQQRQNLTPSTLPLAGWPRIFSTVSRWWLLSSDFSENHLSRRTATPMKTLPSRWTGHRRGAVPVALRALGLPDELAPNS